MNQATAVTLVILEGVGVAILLSFGIAAYIAWRRSKETITKVKHKAGEFLDVTDEFIAKLRKLAAED